MTDPDADDHNSPCRGASISDRRPLTGVRVCYFGRYDPHNARNTILKKCLERAGAEVVQIRDDRSLARRTPALVRRALAAAFDVIVVGFRAHSDMPAARLVATLRRVPLVFDPLTSRYEERVVDRQLVSARSWLARWYLLSDRLGCKAADQLLLETDAQIAYFVETFHVAAAACRRIWLGADDEVMRVQPQRPHDGFVVFFYGRFSPLHGIEHIIRAAALLERRGVPARFVIVGGGQTYGAVREFAASLSVRTVTFVDPVPYARLVEMIGEADVCLGSFGTTARAARVIPYKVFDALAAGRPVITADTPAVREALTHGQDSFLCRAGDAEALADAVAALEADRDWCRRLAVRGHEVFRDRFSIEALTRDLVSAIGPLIRDERAHPVSG